MNKKLIISMLTISVLMYLGIIYNCHEIFHIHSKKLQKNISEQEQKEIVKYVVEELEYLDYLKNKEYKYKVGNVYYKHKPKIS
ncbi:MAG: hypothetical protein GY756_22165 [bacterium]|nr:hypothetical protein [bacterium]